MTRLGDAGSGFSSGGVRRRAAAVSGWRVATSPRPSRRDKAVPSPRLQANRCRVVFPRTRICGTGLRSEWTSGNRRRLEPTSSTRLRRAVVPRSSCCRSRRRPAGSGRSRRPRPARRGPRARWQSGRSPHRPRRVEAQHPSALRLGQERVWHSAWDDRDPARAHFVLDAVDVEQHRPVEQVERLVGCGMGVQRGALARVDGVLEQQESIAHLALADQPAVEAAAVEPPALSLVGVADEGVVVVDMVAS